MSNTSIEGLQLLTDEERKAPDVYDRALGRRVVAQTVNSEGEINIVRGPTFSLPDQARKGRVEKDENHVDIDTNS